MDFGAPSIRQAMPLATADHQDPRPIAGSMYEQRLFNKN